MNNWDDDDDKWRCFDNCCLQTKQGWKNNYVIVGLCVYLHTWCFDEDSFCVLDQINIREWNDGIRMS